MILFLSQTCVHQLHNMYCLTLLAEGVGYDFIPILTFGLNFHYKGSNFSIGEN